MRKTIEKTIQIINSYGEMSNLIIKGNPFLEEVSIDGDSSIHSNGVQSQSDSDNDDSSNSGTGGPVR